MNKDEKLTMLVFYHVGGWVIGNLDILTITFVVHFRMELECIVVSADYRLTLERRFPFAVEDALEAFEWVTKNVEALGGNDENCRWR